MRAAIAILLLALFSSIPVLADGREDAYELNEAGIRLLTEGKARDAIAAFTKARSLLPADLTLRRNLASARSRLGVDLTTAENYAEAEREFRLAMALHPEEPLYPTNLGITLVRRGSLTGAQKALEKAVHVDPFFAPAWAELGSVHYREGRLDEAITAWRKTLVLDPKRESTRKALERAIREYEVEGTHTREESAHFALSWDGEKDASVGARVLRTLEDAYEKVAVDLGIRPSERVQVVLYGQQDFQRVTGTRDWVGGLYDGKIRVPVKNFARAESEIRSTIFHEYVHVAVGSITDKCPTWLNEGLAQIFEGRDVRVSAARVRAAMRAGKLHALRDLNGSFTQFEDAELARLAYAESHCFTVHLSDRYGPSRLGRMLELLGAGKSVEAAAKEAFYRSLAEVFEEWRESL